jgi:hypothetical protein
MTNLCTCGDTEPHVIARRTTADGIAVEVWHDGAITGRCGRARALPGVPIARPRTAEAFHLARRAASLLAGEVCLYDLAELPRLYAGLPGHVRAEFARPESRTLAFSWVTYATDATGTPTVRVARLDRIRWPGLAVWHERGRYELMSIGVHCAPRLLA